MTNLRNLLRITDEAIAHKILAMIAGDLDPREVSNACDVWVRQCHNEPWRTEQVMAAANELLGTYGVEVAPLVSLPSASVGSPGIEEVRSCVLGQHLP